MIHDGTKTNCWGGSRGLSGSRIVEVGTGARCTSRVQRRNRDVEEVEQPRCVCRVAVKLSKDGKE